MEVRKLETHDLPAVTLIHKSAFRDGALTELGCEAVRRYYEWQLFGPHDVVALGAFSYDQLVGFCFGGVFRGALSGFLRKNRSFLVLRVLTHPWLLASPIFRERLSFGTRIIARSSREGRTGILSPSRDPQAQSFGILSIAVDPQHQGLGIGKNLMLEAEVIARAFGFAQMGLTVAINNDQAVRFYEHLGWERVLRDGVWTGSMLKQLESEDGA